MLSGDRLTVHRGERPVLNAVDIDIMPGRMTAVVGPNGAGKSTLINALTGRLPLVRGAVEIDGRAIGDFSRLEIARRVSVLQQQFQTTFAFRAFEVVAMGRAPHERLEKRMTAARIVEAAMSAAGVDHLADRAANQLSGGERQRVFLARALAQIMPLEESSPRYLLLDEPTASLDLSHQRSTLAFARAVAASGIGVLCVLHDLNLASRFADQAIILADGTTAAAGKPADIFDAPTISSVYGDDLSVFPDPETGCRVILPRGLGMDTAPMPADASLTALARQAPQMGGIP